jgi:ABC-type transport system involved in cytochrome c biogenesis permease subunit
MNPSIRPSNGWSRSLPRIVGTTKWLSTGKSLSTGVCWTTNSRRSTRRASCPLESYFNYVSPFYLSLVLYVIGYVVATVGFLGRPKLFNRTAFAILAIALLIHTLGLIARIYISGRPPVTNLYSSALFIGWSCVVFGLVLELIFRIGIGNVVAALSGAAALLIAAFLGMRGDTFTVLQAVLDTQFWLATHVVTITLGYAVTFLAGLLGIFYIFLGVLTRSLTAETSKMLARMIYGTICFAVFFSFIGTVLGGLWADDSWGRFWGWDPKENGALIIVLWSALMLHARWDGLVRERGFAVLAVFGNIVTSWSWFGVNELSVGLHSYGFHRGNLAGPWLVRAQPTDHHPDRLHSARPVAELPWHGRTVLGSSRPLTTLIVTRSRIRENSDEATPRGQR